jgi:superfamily II DNA or RNA helicase
MRHRTRARRRQVKRFDRAARYLQSRTPEHSTFVIEHDLTSRILPTPSVRLFAESVWVTRTEGLRWEHDEVLTPLVAIQGADRDSERRARAILERLGAIDLTCVEEVTLPLDCEADYVVRIDGDSHAYCAFTAAATRELRALGLEVRIDPGYPFHVVDRDVPWFASVEPDEKLPDWFSLELGVEVDGTRVDLLPLVLDMLNDADEAEGLRALERRFRASYALKVSGTHHVTVSPERLRALVRVVIELYQGVKPKRGSKITFPVVRAAALDQVDQALKKCGAKIVWRDPAGIVERARAIAAAPAQVDAPATLRASLRPYQREGVAFLQHLRETELGGVLADDMGLGKTLQTIAHFCVEKAAGRLTSPAIVVAPTSLVGNWARELARFAPHLRVVILHGPGRHAKMASVATSDVVITTYPLLVIDEERLAKETFHLLVLDEAQAIKNTRSLAHQAIRSIQATHRLCLTGTPVENHLGELWSLFDFLSPGLLGDELAFRRWYRQPIEQRNDEERLAALKEQVAPYILRRMKRDVAKELPPKTELSMPVELRGKQRELYEHIRVAAHADVRKVIRAKGLTASTIPILDALMKLRQVCCDPRLVAMDEARAVRESAKLEALFALIETNLAESHRVLLFSQFTSMLALVSEGLRERKLAHLVLTGATQHRQRVVDAFEAGKADVFLISLKAGGTGLNLTSADTVIHYDPWWNPAVQAQATDRAYRIGQKRPVFVANLFVAGSVEERVMKLQQKKRWLSSSLLGDEGGEEKAKLNEGDVEALFAPLEDAEG